MATERNIAAEFAAHLELLLSFHQDDEPDQGQFSSPVESIDPADLDGASRYVTLENGQRLRITVEVA